MEVEMVHTTGSPGRHDSDSEPAYSDRKQRQSKSSSEMALHRKQSRRCKKQMSERQRRKRMNNSMDKLGLLVYGKTFQDGLKVDKATLLKDAYEKLQTVKDDYHKGYETAITSTRSFLDSLQSCPQEVKDALNRHLNSTLLLNLQRCQSSASSSSTAFAAGSTGTAAESSSDNNSSCSPQPGPADGGLQLQEDPLLLLHSLDSPRGGSREPHADSPAPGGRAGNDDLLLHQHRAHSHPHHHHHNHNLLSSHHHHHQSPRRALGTTTTTVSPVSEESPEKQQHEHHHHYYSHNQQRRHHHNPHPPHHRYSPTSRFVVHETPSRPIAAAVESGLKRELEDIKAAGRVKVEAEVEAEDPKMSGFRYSLLSLVGAESSSPSSAGSVAPGGSAPVRRTVVQLAPRVSGTVRSTAGQAVADVTEAPFTESAAPASSTRLTPPSSSALPFPYPHHPVWSFGDSLPADSSPASLGKSLHPHPHPHAHHPVTVLSAAAYPASSYPFSYPAPSSSSSSVSTTSPPSPSPTTATTTGPKITPYVTSFAPQKPLYLSTPTSSGTSADAQAGYRTAVYPGTIPSTYPALTPLSALTPPARSVAAATASAAAAAASAAGGAPSRADDSGYVSPGVPTSPPLYPPRGGGGSGSKYGSVKKRYLQELARARAAEGAQSGESDEENDREVAQAFFVSTNSSSSSKARSERASLRS